MKCWREGDKQSTWKAAYPGDSSVVEGLWIFEIDNANKRDKTRVVHETRASTANPKPGKYHNMAKTPAPGWNLDRQHLAVYAVDGRYPAESNTGSQIGTDSLTVRARIGDIWGKETKYMQR